MLDLFKAVPKDQKPKIKIIDNLAASKNPVRTIQKKSSVENLK